MFKQSFVLFLSLVVAQTAIPRLSVPFSLFDEAKAAVEALRETVLGNIYAAENDLNDFNLDLQSYANNVEQTAEVDIGNEQGVVDERLTVLKDLAASAKVNISYCLAGRENYINNLAPVIVEELHECVFEEIKEGSRVYGESKYLVGITINRVEALDFQLGLCDPDSVGCISPIFQQIELETLNLPQEIEVQVLRAESLFSEIKILTQECGDLKVSQYVSSVNTILDDITQCVDAIIS